MFPALETWGTPSLAVKLEQPVACIPLDIPLFPACHVQKNQGLVVEERFHWDPQEQEAKGGSAWMVFSPHSCSYMASSAVRSPNPPQ